MKRIIGIDVAKLEIVVSYGSKFYQVNNREKDILKWLKDHDISQETIDLIVFEPTGGYERHLKNCLTKLALPYCMTHANYVRAYAKATGQLAKTDKIDCKMIAEYASTMNLKPTTKIGSHQELKSLLDRREQLLHMKQQDQNRLECEVNQHSKKSIKNHIKWLEKEMIHIEEKMRCYIAENESVKTQIELYQSVPSIGWLTAIRIYVDLPEISDASEKSLSALVGLAPMNRDSGKIEKKRHIYGGRSKVRKALYMAVLSAIRFNPVIKSFYERLRQKGKSTLIAMVASARKLLLILHSIAKRQTPWMEKMA